jgi:flagellar biosynthesis/type III secretory pathway chaperone
MNTTNYLNVLSKKIENDKSFLELLKKHSAGTEAYVVDPATVAEVVGTIISIINLFSGNDEDSVYEELIEDMEIIIQLLNEVIELLIELKFIIKEEFRNLIQSELKAGISVIVDNYIGWKESLSSADSRKLALAEKEITDSLLSIRTSARKAFDYGYGYYNNLAMAFSCEFYLLILLKKDTLTKKNAIIRYSNYFNLAINYAISKPEPSLAYTQKEIVANMSALEINFSTPKTFYVGRGSKRTGAPRTKDVYDYFLIVEGNIKDGFSYTDTEIYIYTEYDDSRRIAISDEGINPYATPFGSSAVPRPQIVDSYNKAYFTYNNILKSNLKTLTEAIEGCKKYINTLEILGQTL